MHPATDGIPLDLVTEAQAGDPVAMRKLHAQVRSFVGYLLVALAGRGPGVEDLGSEICAQVFLNLHRFKADGSFTSWVGTTAARQYRRWRRAENRRDRTASDAGILAGPEADRPDEIADRREVLLGAGAAVHRIPRRLLECFTLVDLVGETPTEAAKTIGGNPREIANSAYRARLILRRELELMGLWDAAPKPAGKTVPPIVGIGPTAVAPMGCREGGGGDHER